MATLNKFDYKGHIIAEMIVCYRIKYFVFGDADCGCKMFDFYSDAEKFIDDYLSKE